MEEIERRIIKGKEKWREDHSARQRHRFTLARIELSDCEVADGCLCTDTRASSNCTPCMIRFLEERRFEKTNTVLLLTNGPEF